MAGDTVKVKIVDGYAVFDGTEQRSSGEVDLHPDQAAELVAAGVVELVKASPARKRGVNVTLGM